MDCSRVSNISLQGMPNSADVQNAADDIERARKRLWHAASQGLPLPRDLPICISSQQYTSQLDDALDFTLNLLRVAIWNDHGATVTALLDFIQIDPMCRSFSAPAGAVANFRLVPHNYTLLVHAAIHGSCCAASSLIRAKAEVDGGASTWAPLHAAVTSSRVDMARLLLEAKATVGKTDAHGNFPMHMAVHSDNFDDVVGMIRVLIEAKADINSTKRLVHHQGPSSWGDTAVHQAAVCGQASAVRMLVQAKASVNVQNSAGRSPMLCLVFLGPFPFPKWTFPFPNAPI